METNYLDLFLKALGGWNVNTQLLKEDGSNLQQIDHGLRMRLYENYSYKESEIILNKMLKPDSLLRKTDEFLFSHLFLYIPEEYRSAGDSACLSIGPFSDTRRSRDEIYAIMEKNSLPSNLFNEMCVFYDSIPVIEPQLSFENVILHLAAGLFRREYHLEYMPEESVLFLGSDQILKEVQDNPQIASASIDERYRAENEMITAIASGDYARAYAATQKFYTYQIRPRAKSPIRNKQHLAVIQNTLCRKAVEAGGVPPLYIDELSTRFAILINEITSLSDLDTLTQEMVHKYCLLVQNHSMKGYSPVIKEIVSYIDFHYSEDLNLNFFAEKFNIAKTYLSNLFKKETDTTITDYIHQVRMRKAITLINSSVIPVSAIASACGYNDINYFIRIFKRTYGLSPKQYQKTVVHSTR